MRTARDIRRAVLGLVIVLAVGCGPNARQKAIDTALTGLNAARDGFVAFDRAEQARIVEAAETLEQGQADLKAYRERRAPVMEAFMLAYSALAAAALDPGPEMLLQALDAVKHVTQLLARLKSYEST